MMWIVSWARAAPPGIGSAASRLMRRSVPNPGRREYALPRRGHRRTVNGNWGAAESGRGRVARMRPFSWHGRLARGCGTPRRWPVLRPNYPSAATDGLTHTKNAALSRLRPEYRSNIAAYRDSTGEPPVPLFPAPPSACHARAICNARPFPPVLLIRSPFFLEYWHAELQSGGGDAGGGVAGELSLPWRARGAGGGYDRGGGAARAAG